MIIDVYITLPDASCFKVGELNCGEISVSNGRFQSSFSYDPAWLNHRGFFPIDPESLGLSVSSPVHASMLAPPLSVFRDSLPDDWGRKLLVAQHSLRGSMQADPNLLLKIGEKALGALSFFEHGSTPIAKNHSSGAMGDLQSLMESARRFSEGARDIDAGMLRLFACGGSPGGARPKALVSDGTTHWIAKFNNPSRDDGLDVPGLECVCMDLAKRAGLRVANTRLERFETGSVLLVERFDLSAQGGRFHGVSLHTLCRESTRMYVSSYSEVAEKIRKHSACPDDDCAMFFRQMVFNALVGNVDDHLKNFMMVRNESGYRLSPAFDITPDITGKMEHSLSFLYANVTNGSELVSIGKNWGVENPAEIVAECAQATLCFESLSEQCGVDRRSVQRFADEIAGRSMEFPNAAQKHETRPQMR